MLMMVAQLCEYTKKHWIVYFERVNFMVCELFLNKTVYMYLKKLITLVLVVWIQMNYLLVFELFQFEYNGTLTFIIHEDL